MRWGFGVTIFKFAGWNAPWIWDSEYIRIFVFVLLLLELGMVALAAGLVYNVVKGTKTKGKWTFLEY